MNAAKKIQQKQLTPPSVVKLPSMAAKFLGADLLQVEDFEQWQSERLFLGQALTVACISQDEQDERKDRAVNDLSTVVGLLSESTFVYKQHGAMWEQFVAWYRSGDPWNLIYTVTRAWPEGGLLYCSEVLDVQMALPCLLVQSARYLYEQQRKRDHAKVISEHEHRKASGKWSSEELQAQLTAALLEWEQSNLLEEDEDNDTLIDSLFLNAVQMAESGEPENCLLTGLDWLDDFTGGIAQGEGNVEHIILAGRPGGGKSSLARNIQESICDRGGVVVAFTGEMTKQQWLATLTHQQTGIRAKDLLTGNPRLLRGYDRDPNVTLAKLIRTAERMKGWKMRIIDKEIKPDQIPYHIAKAKAKYGRVDLVILDYIGRYVDDESGRDLRHEFRKASNILLQHNKKTGIPNLVVAQMNRNIEKQMHKKDEERRDPILSDLGESSALEKDATQVWFCDDRGLFVGKSRFGEKGWMPCFFDAAYLRWRGKS